MLTDFTEDKNNTNEQIITFTDSSNVQKGNPNQSKKSASLKFLRQISDYKENRIHSLIDFLKRPRPILDISWSTGSAVNTDIANMNCPDVVLSSDTITCKCNDFAYFKADLIFRFVLNVNKFAIGALLVSYIPVPTILGPTHDDGTLTQATCYPHCIIDASTGQTVEFRVPYTFCNIAWDMIQDYTTPWSEVNVTVLNPLVATQGSTSATVRVWVYCENIELHVPVPNKLVNLSPAKFVAQMDEPDKVASTGKISGVIKKASSVARTVESVGSGPISELGSAASWVLDTAADALDVFGFSKPNDLSTTQTMVQQPARLMACSNGVDASIPAAFDARNSISINNDLFGQNLDPMDINYVCSTPNFIETFNWLTTDPVGKVLASWPVTPGFSGAVSTTTISPTLMAYVASMFTYWRGDISYKLQIVANSFYSGRLGIVYLPRATTVAASYTFDQLDAASQVIFDVRGSTVQLYTAKWALPRPWLRVRCASRTSTGTGFSYANLLNRDVSMGMVFVYVVNTLVAPDSVPTSIPINLFTYGAPSLQFAVPECQLYGPVPFTEALPYEMQAHPTRRTKSEKAKALILISEAKKNRPNKFKERLKIMKTEEVMIAQMESAPIINHDPGEKPRHHDPIKGTSRPKALSICATTIGERVTNLRQLTRCFSPAAQVSIADTEVLELDPAYLGWDLEDVYNTRFYRIGRMYAYWRGSVRWKVVPNVSGVAYPVFTVYSDLSSNSTADGPSSVAESVNSIGFPWFINMAQTPVVEVSAPFYSRNFLQVQSSTDAFDRQLLKLRPEFSGTTLVDVYAAAGDDHSFGFVKAPPLLQLYS